jgi:hypothetical protein
MVIETKEGRCFEILIRIRTRMKMHNKEIILSHYKRTVFIKL